MIIEKKTLYQEIESFSDYFWDYIMSLDNTINSKPVLFNIYFEIISEISYCSTFDCVYATIYSQIIFGMNSK